MGLLDRLNPPQRIAAEATEGPVVILAGAGSGKTACATTRCAHILETCDASPSQVCLMTFTNKAANEMRSRIEGLLGKDRVKGLWAGTFHSLCGRILRKHALLVNRRKDFVIYDDDDQKTLVKQAIEEMMPEKSRDKDKWNPATICERIAAKKQEGLGPNDIALQTDDDVTFVEIWKTYERVLVQYNAMDFEDMILLTLQLLRRDDEVGDELRSKFRYVMVDEFQDTNKTQWELVRLLGSNRNLCVVGDDDQSIYGWRGADVKIIRGFKEAYPDAVVVKLEQNYRSTKRIVSAAHAVISKGKDRLDKQLWTANPVGPKVTVNRALDEQDEALFVAEQVRRLIKASHSPEEIVLLYRSHMLSRVFEEELIAAKVAFRLVGGHGFYDRTEIKGLMAYLRAVVNQDSDVDVQRIINLPHRGIGATTIKRLREIAHSRKVSMIGALNVVGQLAEVRPRERESLVGFRQKYERLRSLHGDTPRPSEYLARLIQETGYKTAWLIEAGEQESAGRNQKAIEARNRAENCDNLVDAVCRYERQCADVGETPSVAGYLERVALITKEKEQSDKEEEKVTLMTVHAAKGTEFEYVFLVGLEEGYLPSKHSIGFVEQEEEERRLAYVAITRAKRQLWCTYASQRVMYGKLESRSPSRFIADLNGAEDAAVELSTGEYRALQRQAMGEQPLA